MQKKVKKKLTVQEAKPEIPSGNFWTMRIEPKARIVLGKDIWPGIMVMKNHGPGAIVVDTGYDFGDSHIELSPGLVRLIPIYKKVDVATIDDSALLEFEYVPKIRLK
ncbi:MAG: hypothetical protein WCC81_11195 [Pseudolabrys sp.]